jgi:dGTPase
VLSPFAQRSRASKGRARPEPPDPVRPIFQHDRDRIIHSKAFRRLAGKTQVFLAPEGDHYRTRITHTLEVAQIARTVTRALGLNETLTEAIVMGHDLGHTPFGHAGEKVLGPAYARRVSPREAVAARGREAGTRRAGAEPERRGAGRHPETFEGKGHIISDNPNLMAMTLEGQIVRISDIVAYVNHDLDDAVRGPRRGPGQRTARDPRRPGRHPRRAHRAHGRRHGVASSRLEEKRQIRMSDEVLDALIALRDFLYETGLRAPRDPRASSRRRSGSSRALGVLPRPPDEFAPSTGQGRPESDGLLARPSPTSSPE